MTTRHWRRGLAAVVALVLMFAGCATLDEQQRRWIFQPATHSWYGASSDDLQDEWITFTPLGEAEPVKLHALWLPSDRAGAPVVLYLHGARWDVLSSSFRMRRLHALGVSVFGIDYRGFGRSSAALPSESMAYEDARAAWEWLRKKHPLQQRLIYGHSLGSAIAVHLASEVDDEAGVIVEGAFTSIPDVYSTLRFGWLPLRPLITQRFNAVDRIASIGSPLLVVHGALDKMIQPALGRALFERAKEPKRFILAETGTHHNAQSMVRDEVREALGSLFGVRAESVAAE
jgi:uncharacterized protein